MNLLNMLMKSFTSSSSLGSISSNTGVSTTGVSKFITLALPVLLRYLTKNASSKSGAASLLNALSEHTEKSAMSSLIGKADVSDGKKILQHILGNDVNGVIETLAENSNLSSNGASSILENIAPALLSGVSAATNTSASSAPSSTSRRVTSKTPKKTSDDMDLTSLLGIFGGDMSSSNNDIGDDLLGSLFGAAPAKKTATKGTRKSSSSDFGLGEIFSLADDTADNEKVKTTDGTELLGSLLSAMKNL